MTTFLIIFAATTMAAVLIGQWLFPSRSGAVNARLRQIGNPQPVAVQARLEGMDNQSLLRRAGAMLDPLVRKLRITDPIEDMLTAADMPIRVSEFLAMTAFAAFAGGLVAHVFWGMPLTFVGMAAGAAVPFFKVKRKATARRAALNEQLPDALMLMVNALRAGNSLTQSMGVVSQQMPAPINGTFGTAIQEVNFGLSIDEALFRLRERFGGVDMSLATTAIAIQRETGGNLAEILDNIHNTIRDRQTVQGELRALTAQGRLSGWVLSLLPVGIGGLFFLFNKAYIMTLFLDPRGQLLVGGAVVLTVIGMLVIRKIVNVPF